MKIFKKAFILLLEKPTVFFKVLRNVFLFYLAYFLRPLRFPQTKNATVRVGKDVVLQNLAKLTAQKPNALLSIGNNCVIFENAEIGAYGTGKISIGDNSIIGDVKIFSRYQINIGKRVLTSWNVFIQDYDPHPVAPDQRAKQVIEMSNNFLPLIQKRKDMSKYKLDWDFPGKAITIGDDVWIGANVSILKGANIGNGCIIGTGSVVIKGNYPDNSIIAGNPAKVVKEIKE